MIDDFARRMQSQGLTMDQYMQFTGTTLASLQEQMKPQALKRIQTRLVLEKIAEAEAIEIADEKIDEEINKMAEMYKMEADKLKEMLGDAEKEQMKKRRFLRSGDYPITIVWILPIRESFPIFRKMWKGSVTGVIH